MRARLTLVSLCSIAAIACGGTDDAGLFKGGNADAGIGGGTTGGTSGTGATAGVSGSGTGGGATGGNSGSGGNPSGGASGSGGNPSGGASGSGGGSGSGGEAGSGGASGDGGTGGATGGTGGATGGTGGATGGTGGTGGGPVGPSCEGKCGSTQPQSTGSGQCFCDAQCIALGDCCPNWSKACNAFVPGQVNCGNAKCNTASEMCCQQYSQQTDSYTPKCQSKGSSCVGPDIFCDDPSDCGSGQVCCASLGTGSTFVSLATCRGSGDCRHDQQRVVLCGGSPSVCPSGTNCETMTFLGKYDLPQYNVCQ